MTAEAAEEVVVEEGEGNNSWTGYKNELVKKYKGRG